MRCNFCGIELNGNSANCPNCGAPVTNVTNGNMQPNYGGQPMGPRPMNQPMGQPMGPQPMNQQPQRPIMQQPPRQSINQGNGQVQNPYNRQQYNANNQNANKGNGNNVVKICIIVVVAVAVFVLAGFGVYFLVTGNNKGGNNTGNNTGNNSNTTTNDGNITVGREENSKSNYQVKFKGFKFLIPDNLVYSVDNQNGQLKITDQESTWIVLIGVNDKASFEQVKKNKSAVKQNLLQTASKYSGTVSDVELETINGREFLVAEVSLSGENMIIAYSGLNSMNTAYVQVINEDNEYDRDLLNTVATILDSAKYVGTTEKLEPKVQLDEQTMDSIMKSE